MLFFYVKMFWNLFSSALGWGFEYYFNDLRELYPKLS